MSKNSERILHHPLIVRTPLVIWNGQLHRVEGFRTVGLRCGLKKKKGRPDIGLLVAERPVPTAAVFTKNLICAAPVRLSKLHLKRARGQIKAVIVNAGNANACTGEQGERDALRMAELTAQQLNCKVEEVLVCSTGVIGHHLQMQKVEKGIAAATSKAKTCVSSGSFTNAILTTDLVPKTAGVKFEIEGKIVHIAGTCKGSGMIAPNMATMLAYIVTDAQIKPSVLQKAFSEVVDETFNALTVDGDTSTNDTAILMASCKAAHKPIEKASGPAYSAFKDALLSVCDRLALQIAADGEGATHTITVYVGGTQTDREARQIARTISDSPLVKTAIAGCDPNWGRIVAAAGRSGVSFDPAETVLTVCGHEIFRAGTPTQYDRAQVAASLKARDVSIVFMAGNGPGHARFYTCDLTHGYITINAEYHT